MLLLKIDGYIQKKIIKLIDIQCVLFYVYKSICSFDPIKIASD